MILVVLAETAVADALPACPAEPDWLPVAGALPELPDDAGWELEPVADVTAFASELPSCPAEPD